MARLELRLLGGFLLRVDARARPVPARKVQALLAYLAVRAGRAHAREPLAALLWGDVGERQARQSLRQTMVRVRRAFGPARAALVVQGDTVALGPALLDTDVAAFERLVRRGTTAALEEAVALYRGPFLDGVRVAAPAFEEWLDSERARLADLALGALRRLLDGHVRGGRVEAAVQAATRLLALDSLQEDVHRVLMRLHVRQGRRAAALRQYQACVAVLQRELAVEPEAATRQLYLDILRAASPAAGARPRGPGGAPATRAPAAGDAPLVGRDAELGRLRQRLRAALRGEGQVVLVTGEAGIGKSRLVDELAAAVSARAVRFLAGRAHETEQILPFRPWVDALRGGRALAGLRDWPAALAARRADLARLFPELGGGDAPPSLGAPSHVRLFESLHILLGALAREQPLVVVLEDLQWADEMSLRLLAFVGRRLAERPILLVGAVRDEDAGEAPMLARMVDELAGLPHVERLALGPLTRPATAALVRALARSGSHGADLAATVDRVWALSEGNPFVIVETMRALGASPAGGRIDLPPRVRDLVAARVARLGPRAQELARLASVFPREIEFAVLQRAAGLTRRETAAAVEELVRRRILDAVGERFEFAHARIRETVYEGLLAPRRQALHAAVAEATEAVYAGRLDEVHDRLAHHFSAAGEPGRALTHLVQLADKAARTCAFEDAARLLNDALAAAECVGAAEGARRRLDIVYRLAPILAVLGRPTAARSLLLAHEPLAVGLGDPRLGGVHHFWLAYIHGSLGEGALAMRSGQRALEEAARAGDDATMGKASYALSREYYMSGRAREAIAHGRQAVALLERSPECWWLGLAMGTLGLCLLHVGDGGRALEVLERMRAVCEDTGDERLQAEAAWRIGRVHTVMGDGDAAVAACRASLELSADPVARATATGWLGAAHAERGDHAEAVRLLEDAIGRLRELSGAGGFRSGQLDPMLTAVLAEAYLAQGETERASAASADALAGARAGGWPVAVGYAERAAGRVALAAGRLREAEASLETAVRTFAAAETHAQVGRSRLELAAARAARGDKHGAAAELRAAHDLFTRLGAHRLAERARRRAAECGVSLEASMLVLHAPLPEVGGQACEALLAQAYYYRGGLVSEANALFLKLAGGPWHRLFIQAGVVFWQAVDALDSPDHDRHHYTFTDLAAAHGLAGKRLAGITTADLPSGGELRLVFTGAPSVVLRHADGRSEILVDPGRAA